MQGPQSVIDVAAGGSHSLALTRTGEIWAWGGNLNGQVGDGTSEDRWRPVLVVAAGFNWPIRRPQLSPPPGSYAAAIQVTMTVPAGCVVRYTTDGSDPSAASHAYQGPIPLEGSLELRARAFDPGGRASAEAGGWYSFHFGTLEPPSISPVGGLT